MGEYEPALAANKLSMQYSDLYVEQPWILEPAANRQGVR